MTSPTSKTALIVGAGGFIGGFIAKEALERGLSVTCLVRSTTSRRWLADPRLAFIVCDDFDSPEAIARALDTQSGAWDYIIYNLGATKATNFADFNRINFSFLRNFIEALRQTGMIPSRLLYISSLSALGKGDEKGYTPFTDSSIPCPDTRYGLSKMKAETLLDTTSDIPWTVLRPTGVYGPHEQDYLMMVKCIAHHIDFGIGFRRQMLTFIYVEDLARAILDAVASPATKGRKYIVSELRSYSQSEFRKIVAEELGVRGVIPIRLPLWAAKTVCVIAEKWGVARLKPSTLNTDKYNILKQRNWQADCSRAVADFGFAPKVGLREGIRRVIADWRNSNTQKS
ncbi:MAG: NAD(P)-dependent oxidoreductase [Pseudoflavonifractor sp.]|nr:NAD(P)-dependent oxidoreductase [Alloprevotella sp.]MCM1117404.1 NAD(P)-dependent oxidoreductase [Pseudoflavonifractor sp.]